MNESQALPDFKKRKQKRVDEQITDFLRNELKRGKFKPGTRLPTTQALADRWQINVATVHTAMKSLVEEGLLVRKLRLGTFVSERKASSRHAAIWVSSSVQQPMPNYWTARIMCRLPGLLRQQEIPTKLYWSWSVEHGQYDGFGYDEFLEGLTRDSISVIAHISGWWGEAAERLIQQRQVPIVYSPGVSIPGQLSVSHDEAAVIRQGVEHLLAQGCRRIAWLAWRDLKSGPGDVLYETFCSALRERGVEARESWVCTDLDPNLSGAGYSEFREIWTAHPEKPDGLLVTDDVLFQDVVTAISELGISVPSQLKVVTIINRGAAVPCPSFPAARIEIDPDAHAEAMSEMLVKLVRKQPIAEPQVIVPFRLIEGYPLEPTPAKTETFQVNR